jgi:hypothetical protein
MAGALRHCCFSVFNRPRGTARERANQESLRQVGQVCNVLIIREICRVTDELEARKKGEAERHTALC